MTAMTTVQLALTKDSMLQDGFSIVPQFFTTEYIDELIAQLESHNVFDYDKPASDTSANLIHVVPAVKSLAHATQIMTIVEQVLGATSFPITAFILDKTEDNNWGLDWHQDLKISVKRKIETSGYSNWTEESGIPHVIPPLSVLEKRMSVRIHLDNCFIENGAMLVAPKSHKMGMLSDTSEIEKITSGETRYCEIEKAGVMFFTPLLLHKSPYATTNKKRRVLQIDYAGTKLMNGLEWNN